MKARVGFVKRVVYEVELTPEEYCNARAQPNACEDFHKKVFSEGTIVSTFEEWKDVTTEDFVELEKFFEEVLTSLKNQMV